MYNVDKYIVYVEVHKSFSYPTITLDLFSIPCEKKCVVAVAQMFLAAAVSGLQV